MPTLFPYSSFFQIFPREAKVSEISEEIASLKENGIVNSPPNMPEHMVIFSNNLFQEVAYNMLLESYRCVHKLSYASFLAEFTANFASEKRSIKPLLNIMYQYSKKQITLVMFVTFSPSTLREPDCLKKPPTTD